MARRKPSRCPRCGSYRIVRILYGLPPADVGAAAGRGEVILGGCMVGEDPPEWGCGDCHWEQGLAPSASRTPGRRGPE